MAVHVAVIRRVKPGCEAEFQRAVREFFQASLAEQGVQGVHLLLPPPGGDPREHGILRTFAGPDERDAFYASPLFKAWESRVQALVDGEPERRELHGLEAWFRAPGGPPPRWKMAVITFAGVYVVTTSLPFMIGPAIEPWPLLVRSAAFNGVVVVLLTWVVMPLLIRLAHGWLHRER